MQSFGKWLLEKRKAAKLTQGQLAQKSGISTSYVSTLEREQKHTVTNVTPQPAADVVESIARALGVPVDEARLLGGDYGHTTIVIDVSVNRSSSRVEPWSVNFNVARVKRDNSRACAFCSEIIGMISNRAFSAYKYLRLVRREHRPACR